MAAQFRTTPCGMLVRLVSRKKVLRYPDEVDGSVIEQFVVASTRAGEEQGAAEQGGLSKGEMTDNEGVHIVDWYGEDDPENPRNWSRAYKILIVFQLCVLNFSIYIASSIYVPGEASIMDEFHVSETVATLGLSLFTLGYGLGPMLWSPISEMPRLGRSSIFFYTTLAFILLQLPTGYATSMPMFLVFRFLSGFIGSPCLATGGGIIADIYFPQTSMYAICVWGSAGICGPVFGPIFGGYVAAAKGWRWTVWVYAWMCVGAVACMFFCWPETSEAAILLRRAKRLREGTGDESIRSRTEVEAQDYVLRDHLRMLATAFTLTFTEPIVFLMHLYTALLYGVLFIWFESFPLVFGDIYHFDLGQQGLVFLGIFVGAVVSVPPFLLWLRYTIAPRIAKPGFKPEKLLPPTFAGTLALPICLFWYGWSARESMHWIMPVIGSAWFSVGVVTLFNSVFNYLGVSYPKYVASIFAGNALFRATFGAIFPLFARSLFRRLGVGAGNSLLGGVSICFIPIPFIFWRYGEIIRHMSKNARHDV
ncbi:MFS general substrate transporter [Polyplosphaeria fusca]|uniref:MFS general substrate transporter n=1 Tax=Polyplosphaeria fusca TaxID=682080 RepID=A0A9P4R2F4_9PLEO|nr:MFS general substrate transporter [Polyplosphaeria fusca]